MNQVRPHPIISVLTGLCLLLSSASPHLSGVALAQSGDMEAPVIGFDELREGRRGDTQVFSANVTDDNQVTEVTLYYRANADIPYTRVAMEAIPGTPIYTVSVSDISPDANQLEYYIEARDQVGNRSLRGFAFDPLVRDLVSDTSAPAVAAAPVGQDAGGQGMSTGRKVLYGVLGLLVVGALAAAASGDSDSSTGAGDGNTVPLTIEVGRPPALN